MGALGSGGGVARRPGMAMVLAALCVLVACAAPAAASCVMSPHKEKFNKGDRMPVCIVVNSTEAGGGPQKAVFYPRVDEYTVLELPASARDALFTTRLLPPMISVEANGVAVAAKRYRGEDGVEGAPSSEWRVPYYTAVVRLSNGVVDEVVWDDGCRICPDDECVDGVCGVHDNDCGADNTCNVKVYVAFIGDDKSDEVCTSASMVFSNFENFSLGPIMRDARNASPDPSVPEVPDKPV